MFTVAHCPQHHVQRWTVLPNKEGVKNNFLPETEVPEIPRIILTTQIPVGIGRSELFPDLSKFSLQHRSVSLNELIRVHSAEDAVRWFRMGRNEAETVEQGQELVRKRCKELGIKLGFSHSRRQPD